jgi:hypothetical protein
MKNNYQVININLTFLFPCTTLYPEALIKCKKCLLISDKGKCSVPKILKVECFTSKTGSTQFYLQCVWLYNICHPQYVMCIVQVYLSVNACIYAYLKMDLASLCQATCRCLWCTTIKEIP